MIQTKTAYSFSDAVDDPCFGCISDSCTSCPCAGERLDIAEQKKLLRVSEVSPKKKARKKTTVPAERKEWPTEEDSISKLSKFGNFELTAYIRLPTFLYGEIGEAVVLTAEGDGMQNAGIRSGDQLVFDMELQPQDGDIVMATVNGMVMCRRYFREGEQYRIRREDGSTPDIVTSDCVILGVLVGLTRRYSNRR